MLELSSNFEEKDSSLFVCEGIYRSDPVPASADERFSNVSVPQHTGAIGKHSCDSVEHWT